MAERWYMAGRGGQVIIRDGVARYPLDPRLDLRESSFAGFSWGEEQGSGSTQLAIALLADALDDGVRAIELYEDFGRRVVAIFPDRWTISRSRIRAHAVTIEKDKLSREHLRAMKPRLPAAVASQNQR